jgi:hypothetical protein
MMRQRWSRARPQSVRYNPPHATQAPPRQTRKQAERRATDRRRQDSPVLLDTRSGHDRRNALAEEKSDIEGEENSATTTGIDIYT